jgi:lipid A 3-O-deacylase
LGQADAARDTLSGIRLVAGVVALWCATTPAFARAQTPLTLEVRADNDVFNFWQPPPKRPDEEYTSGVRAALEFSGAAPWERWLHAGIAPCKVGVAPCATHSFAFGQDIYTGETLPNDTTLVKGTRPNAGWLFVEESSKIERTNRLDETSITIGVTGPPALGQTMQRIFHDIAPADNRPINWNTELPFEPGIVLAWDHTERWLAAGDGKLFGFDVEPHGGASLGNILTEGRAGMRVRTGFRMQHPWLLAAIDSTDTTPVISFLADATVHGVARNEFLAGTMFRASPHVDERPFVSEYQVGATFRLEQFSLSWVAHQVSSEYFSRANGHAWSRIEVVYRFAR